jgi:Putative zinc-finger
MRQISHENCSELLPLYERGRLSASKAADVEAHLASCEDCARELTGLNYLRAADAAPMTEGERAHLHNAVAEAMRAELRRGGEVEALDRRRRRENMWPVLRVAAAAAVVVAGFVFVPNLLTGETDENRSGADLSRAGQVPEAAPAPGDPVPIFKEASTAEALDAATEEAAGVAQAARVAQPDPPYSPSDLRRLGRSQPFTKFAAAYTTEDAQRLAESYLEELAMAAPNDGVASAVRACGEEVLAAATTPTLPAYAAYEVALDRRSLLLGLVSSKTGAGPLDRYEIWVWANADCDSLTTRIFEDIGASE